MTPPEEYRAEIDRLQGLLDATEKLRAFHERDADRWKATARSILADYDKSTTEWVETHRSAVRAAQWVGFAELAFCGIAGAILGFSLKCVLP